MLSCHPASNKPPIFSTCLAALVPHVLYTHIKGKGSQSSTYELAPTAAEADFDHQSTSDGSTSHSSQGGCPWGPRRFQVVRRAELYSSRKLSWPFSYGSSGAVAEGPRSQL